MGESGIICRMASKNDEEVVRRAPLFTALDDASSATLRASMSGIKISKGQVLFKEGDAGDRLFVVVEGKLKLGTLPSNSSIILLLKPFIFFAFALKKPVDLTKF